MKRLIGFAFALIGLLQFQVSSASRSTLQASMIPPLDELESLDLHPEASLLTVQPGPYPRAPFSTVRPDLLLFDVLDDKIGAVVTSNEPLGRLMQSVESLSRNLGPSQLFESLTAGCTRRFLWWFNLLLALTNSVAGSAIATNFYDMANNETCTLLHLSSRALVILVGGISFAKEASIEARIAQLLHIGLADPIPFDREMLNFLISQADAQTIFQIAADVIQLMADEPALGENESELLAVLRALYKKMTTNRAKCWNVAIMMFRVASVAVGLARGFMDWLLGEMVATRAVTIVSYLLESFAAMRNDNGIAPAELNVMIGLMTFTLTRCIGYLRDRHVAWEGVL